MIKTNFLLTTLISAAGLYAANPANQDYDYKIVAKTGDTIAGHTISSFKGVLTLDDKGVLYFGAFDQSDSSVLFRNDSVIVMSGDKVGGITLATSVGPIAVNDSGPEIFGALVYYPTPQFQQAGLFHPRSKVAVPGEVIDRLTIQNVYDFGINDSGEIVFGTDYTSEAGPGTAIFREHHLFVRSGDEVGGYVLTRVDPYNIGLSGNGVVAFRGASSGVEGIFTQYGALVKTGDIVGGLTITDFPTGLGHKSFSLSEAGEIAFTANPNGAAFVSAHNAVLAKIGDPLPESPVPFGQLVSFDVPSINYFGDVVYVAHGGEAFMAPRYSVLLKNKTLMVGFGDTILGHPSSGVGLVAINDAGQIAFLCTFTDIGNALVVATPKHP
jgi:hypothetical protein